MKIAIIGAGPAGNYCAFLLQRQGHEVHVYEKNKVVGPPVQCTGILSDYFEKLLKPSKEYVLNTVHRTRIYAPNNKYVDAPIKKNYVVCRKKFDSYLADMAKEAGVQYFMQHSLQSFTKGKIVQLLFHVKGGKKHVEYDVLIGADGPNSTVAKSCGAPTKKCIVGAQIEARMDNDNVVEFYPYIGCYAWIVPVDKKTVRIGVAAYKNAPALFKQFAKEKIGVDYSDKMIENQSGIIPIFNPSLQTQYDNVFLLGDAAGMVKATSGGGINQGLKAASYLAMSIPNEDYHATWRKKMYYNLLMHLIIHEMMQKFSDKDWNRLIATFSKPRMKKILYKQSRDKIIPMLIKIGMTNPMLFLYGRYFPFGLVKKSLFP